MPLDIVAATPQYLAEKRDSLTSLLRSAIEEGVTLADRQRLPYTPNTAAARGHEAAAPEPPPPNARPHQPDEARSWLKHALYKLEEAEIHADRKPGGCVLTAAACGASRSAVESALKARIVAHGVRPRKYKEPPELAREAVAAGETLPQFELHAFEAIGRYYNGRIHPGYPEPKVAEACCLSHPRRRPPAPCRDPRPPRPTSP